MTDSIHDAASNLQGPSPIEVLRHYARETPRRQPNDDYPTPDALCRAVVARLPGWTPSRILEPSAGEGAWVRALVERWPDSFYRTIDPYKSPAPPPPRGEHSWCPFEAFFAGCQTTGETFDLVIGNPPYKLAEEHVRLALSLLAPGGRLVFLLRLAFLASSRRYPLWCSRPPESVLVLAERPSFSANGKTDSSDYAIFTWVNGAAAGHEPARRVDWLTWKDEEECPF